MKDIIFTLNPSKLYKKDAKIIHIGPVTNRLELCNCIVTGLNYPYYVQDNWDALIDKQKEYHSIARRFVGSTTTRF